MPGVTHSVPFPLVPACGTMPDVFTLRCTKRLLDRLGVRADESTAAATTSLGDWYANLVYVERKPVVLAIAERTLLPVLIPLAPARTLASRLVTGVSEVLCALGVTDAAITSEVDAMREARIGRTDSRAVVGTLVDFAKLLEMYEGDDRSLRTLARDLAETPCGMLKGRSPRRATIELMEEHAL